MFTQKIRAHVLLIAFKNNIAPNSKVLDIGCGNGIISKLIQSKLKCNVTGADVLDYAEGISFKKIEDPYNLPFNKDSFDCSLLIDTLHHIKDQNKVILEALRVSKKLLIFDIEPGFWAWFTDVFLNYLTNKDMEKTFTNRTIKQWEHLFEDLNLKYKIIKFKKPLWYPLPQFAFEVQK